MTTITQITQKRGNTNSRFRKLCFTLNNYKNDDYSKLLQFCEKCQFKYIIGKEVGESGTPHLQGYIEFGKQLSFKQIKEINNEMHFERPLGSRTDNIKYCSKDGDYVTNFKEPLHKRLLKKYNNINWKDWQQNIINIVESEPDDRTIHWYWEPTGKVGKSFLAKYLILKYDAIICSGKQDNVFNQVKTWMDKNKNEESPKVIVCDIPRTCLNYLNYGTLEKLKDGALYSGKYEGGICILDNVHVICLANVPPDTHTMSADRWDIHRI